MTLNELGIIVEEEWLKTKLIRKNADLDFYIIMPNHIHGIIIINGSEVARQITKKKLAVETHSVRLYKVRMETRSVRLYGL